MTRKEWFASVCMAPFAFMGLGQGGGNYRKGYGELEGITAKLISYKPEFETSFKTADPVFCDGLLEPSLIGKIPVSSFDLGENKTEPTPCPNEFTYVVSTADI